MAENEKRDTAADEIEVTPAMIEAGINAYFDFSRDDDSEMIVATIFEAMLRAAALRNGVFGRPPSRSSLHFQYTKQQTGI